MVPKEARRICKGGLESPQKIRDRERDRQDAPQVTFDSSACTINPSSNILDSVQYTVTIGSGVITDAGVNVATSPNPYAGLSATTYQFVTEDLTVPTMSTYNPAQAAGPTIVPVSSNVVLTFSETVVAGARIMVLTLFPGFATTLAVDAPQVTSSSACTLNPSSNVMGSVSHNYYGFSCDYRTRH